MPEERFESFRPAERHELEEVAEVVNHSFPGPGRGRVWWRDLLAHGPHGGPEDIWVAEEAGRIVGACLLLPLTQWIAGAALPTMGLGVVTIGPTHRRRGLAERMITAGLRHARARGDQATALYPFRVGYYEGLGYGLAGEAHQYVLPPAALPDDPEGRRRMRDVRTEEDRARLRDLYARGVRLENGQVERTEASWRHVLEGDDRAALLYVGSSGDPEGYVLVRYRADVPLPERYLDVEERMWLTPAARSAIYGWLSSMGDQWPRLAYRAHPDERFGDVVTEPRLPVGSASGWNLWFPAATLLHGPMFRLLEVPEALRTRNFEPAPEFTLRLEVDDAQIPENRGPWRVRLADGRAEVDEDAGAADATLSLPVRVLSRIYIGALTPSEALTEGLARIDRPESVPALDAAFRTPRPWTFERF